MSGSLPLSLAPTFDNEVSFLLDINEVLCALVSKDLSLNFYISVNLLYIRDSITSASATNGGLFSYKQGLGWRKRRPLVQLELVGISPNHVIYI